MAFYSPPSDVWFLFRFFCFVFWVKWYSLMLWTCTHTHTYTYMHPTCNIFRQLPKLSSLFDHNQKLICRGLAYVCAEIWLLSVTGSLPNSEIQIDWVLVRIVCACACAKYGSNLITITFIMSIKWHNTSKIAAPH